MLFFHLRHGMSRDEHWEELKRTRGKAVGGFQGLSLLWTDRTLLRELCTLWQKGSEGEKLPCFIIAYGDNKFRTTQHIPRYPGYVKLHPEQKTWWRWRLGTWWVMTSSLVITGGVLLAWYPGVLYSDENALERYGMV